MQKNTWADSNFAGNSSKYRGKVAPSNSYSETSNSDGDSSKLNAYHMKDELTLTLIIINVIITTCVNSSIGVKNI